MKRCTGLFLVSTSIGLMILLVSTGKVWGQTTNFSSKDAPAAEEKAISTAETPAALTASKETTEQALAEKKQSTETAKKEAEKAIVETKAIEKEAQLKQEAATAAQKEAELLKKQAQTSNNPELAKKAKELTTQADQLKKEAATANEKLAVAQSKALVAQKTIDSNLAMIESLQKELDDMRAQQVVRMTLPERATRIATIILIGLFLLFLLKFLLGRFEKLISQKGALREAETILRMKTLSKLLGWLGSLSIVAAVLYMVLEYFGLNMAPLLAGAGIVGLAFGFGGQYLIRDLINGLFILIEGQYRVNDVVKINDLGGLVEDINLRITVLRDLEGRVIIIPNGEVKTVINYTKGYAQALFDVGVAYKENVDRVMDVIKEVGKGMRKDAYFGRLILDDLEMFGVDAFADSQVTIKFRIKTLPIKQWEVAREFRRRLKNRFDELGIEIPFPHRTIYWGTGEDNMWVKEFAAKIAKKNH